MSVVLFVSVTLNRFSGLRRLREAREEFFSNFRDGLTVNQLESLVEGVGANNASSAGVHKNATHAGFCR
jgi:hypothetical protein